MADIKIISPTERYKAIADAIREKSGTTELMQPADMPQMILELSGGAEYTDITYNEDNTITLTDKDGVVHTMECEYSEDGKLTSLKYDGKSVALEYDGGLLVKVGKTTLSPKCMDKLLIEGLGIDYTHYPYVFVELAEYPSVVNCNIRCFSAQPTSLSSRGLLLKGDVATTPIIPIPTTTNIQNVESVIDAILSVADNPTITYETYSGFAWSFSIPAIANFDFEHRDENTTLMDSIIFSSDFALGLASGGVVEVIDTTEIDNLETLIDQSGVLEDTEGSVEEKVEQLIEKAEDENLWYEMSGSWTDLPSGFKKAQVETLPKMDLSKVTTLTNTFSGMANLKRVDYYLNTESCTNHVYAFAYSKKLEYVKGINTSKSTDVNGMFRDCNALKTIEEPLDFSSTTNTSAFRYTPALENVRFVEKTIKYSIAFNSPLLSAESIQSIIDGLATVETAQTLTLNSAIALTDEQKATINAKGWTLAQ